MQKLKIASVMVSLLVLAVFFSHFYVSAPPAPGRSTVVTSGSNTKSCDIIVYRDGSQAVDLSGITGDNRLVTGNDYAIIADAISNTPIGGKLCFQGAATYALGANTMTIPVAHFMYLDFAANVTITSSGATTFKANSPVIITGDPTFIGQNPGSGTFVVFFHNAFDVVRGSTNVMLRVRGNAQNGVYIDGASFDGTYILDVGDSINDRFQNGLELVDNGGNFPNNNVFINYRCGLAVTTYTPTGGQTACVNIVHGSQNMFINVDVGYGAFYGFVIGEQKEVFLNPHCESLNTCFLLNAGGTGTVISNLVTAGVTTSVVYNGGSAIFSPIGLGSYTAFGTAFGYQSMFAAGINGTTTASTSYVSTGLCVSFTPNFLGRTLILASVTASASAANVSGTGIFVVYRTTGSCPTVGSAACTPGPTCTTLGVIVIPGTAIQTSSNSYQDASLTIGTTYQYFLAWKTKTSNTETVYALYDGKIATDLTVEEI